MPRITVNLSKQREAAVAASGKTLVELIDLGLEAAEQKARQPKVRPARPGEPPGLYVDRNREPLTPANCKHPRARRSKGGLCMACGTNVGDT
jgi:hypothetical protein